ncbi:hypothetical protein, partial [Aeromonas caviae]
MDKILIFHEVVVRTVPKASLIFNRANDLKQRFIVKHQFSAPNSTESTQLLRSIHFGHCSREGANKRGNSSRLTQSFHFFMFEPIFSPVNA